ncbi:P-loop containing nucleoside triphosphate hydrolase protein, partial [Mycena sanguinolenta]
MPRQPTVTEIRLENLAACLVPTLEVLNELSDAFDPPFVQPISNAVASLLMCVQNVKRNKKECARLLENTNEVLYAILNLHIKSEVAGTLPPAMTEHVGKFMITLHKIFTYVQAQQDGNKIRKLFQYNETNNLLKDCDAELDQAKKVFEVGTGSALFKDIREMKRAAEIKHKELLELISTMSETNTTTDGSSLYMDANELKSSSNSFSLLPSKPKIFYGRETQLKQIVQMLDHPSPRIAILGGGGMGKTSLARAALHHQDTLARFEERFFVSAEPATTSVELAALIGLHVGLNPGKDLTKAVVQYFSRKPSSLLILDNLETAWEPIHSRAGVEEFLSLLTDVDHLSLIVTMRGAERPARILWTRPFLLPLQPLSNHAAEQTFMDITDNSYSAEVFSQLLSFTDNLPLAVDLLAHLVDCEGLENVLARWETEKTALLSVGYNRKSNLDASINLSLSSSRITSESKELLSLLSILPNGLSDTELIQSKLPISNILSCKAALLATSLAHRNSNNRLLLLMPVREHIQQSLAPSPSLVYCLQKHFHALLKLFKKHRGEQWQSVIKQITLNLGNLQKVLQRGLYVDHSELADTV